jgi:hypothetical protein
MRDDVKPEWESPSDADELDLDQAFNEERDQARDYVCGEITRYAVEILEYYSKKLGKNDALGMTIECFSECLGNLVSLVHEDNQSEVLESSQQVIHQGLINQQELIAEMAYGQVGHA